MAGDDARHPSANTSAGPVRLGGLASPPSRVRLTHRIRGGLKLIVQVTG